MTSPLPFRTVTAFLSKAGLNDSGILHVLNGDLSVALESFQPYQEKIANVCYVLTNNNAN